MCIVQCTTHSANSQNLNKHQKLYIDGTKVSIIVQPFEVPRTQKEIFERCLLDSLLVFVGTEACAKLYNFTKFNNCLVGNLTNNHVRRKSPKCSSNESRSLRFEDILHYPLFCCDILMLLCYINGEKLSRSIKM